MLLFWSWLMMFLFFRWKTFQLSLGWLWQKICTIRWAFPAPPHSHRWEEICMSCVWSTFHAKWPLNQAHSSSHDHQALCSVDHWCAWAEQDITYSASVITVFCLPQCSRTCLKLGPIWPLFHLRTISLPLTIVQGKHENQGCYISMYIKQTVALDFFSYHLLLFIRTFFFFYI